MPDENLLSGEPEDKRCRIQLDDCIMGEKIVIQASKIAKCRLIPRGGHRSQWTKADNAKCWIERAIEVKQD